MPIVHASRRRLLAATAALAIGATAPLAIAQSGVATPYPTKPVKLVVGYAAGGATDVLARLLAQTLTEQTGQTFLVDNRPGANSNVGADIVAHATPDGYTIYLFTIANTINPGLYDKLPYDPVKDFEPVGLIATVPNILVVNPTLPITTVKEYVAFAKSQPNGITFASSGSGSSIHLSGELFKMQSKSNMLHVPYRGSGPAVADLLGGQVESMFDNAPSCIPQVKGGRLRAIAITSAQRVPQLPDVPTIAESGYPDYSVTSWFALAAPVGTPKPVIDKLNAELNKALANADVKARMYDLIATPKPGTPDDMKLYIATELKRWAPVVKASGARAE